MLRRSIIVLVCLAVSIIGIFLSYRYDLNSLYDDAVGTYTRIMELESVRLYQKELERRYISDDEFIVISNEYKLDYIQFSKDGTIHVIDADGFTSSVCLWPHMGCTPTVKSSSYSFAIGESHDYYMIHRAGKEEVVECFPNRKCLSQAESLRDELELTYELISAYERNYATAKDEVGMLREQVQLLNGQIAIMQVMIDGD